MASKINILSDALMKRIAAGEVVERPASVAKELMENSIDADATSITLIVKGSGSDIIQVVDNGEGMPEEDVLICTARHATSKISHEEDLEAIHTLGFRGEALSSIASVSRMVITTCTRTDTEGTQVHVEGGVIREVLKVAANPGTNVEVKTLFYNVPARKKFLKHQSTELRRIITAFRRLALSHPHIDFSLFIEDEKTMDLISDTQENRVRALMR